MEVKELIKQICERGEASARNAEEGSHLEGALAGFRLAAESVNTDNPVETLQKLLEKSTSDDRRLMDNYHRFSAAGQVADAKQNALDDYWRSRYCTLQLEWVLEVLNVGLHLKPYVSARATRAYADIVGVGSVQ